MLEFETYLWYNKIQNGVIAFTRLIQSIFTENNIKPLQIIKSRYRYIQRGI